MREPPNTACLLRIPLLRHALSDPSVTIHRRAIDRQWAYERLVSISVGGFNPYRRAMYIAAESALADWLAGGCVDDREHNEADALMGELLFFVHDYLHVWAVAEIQQLRPELGFGAAPITPENFEAMVFCHLLTEAAATAGLDYWYLATVDLNEVTDIGTTYSTLTVPYHERDLREYRRLNPAWDAQTVDAFVALTRFYCSGAFAGFSISDIRRSALLHAWLNHEIRYGVNQRAYTRQWLAHLSNGAIAIAYEDSKGPVGCDAGWQRELTRALGERLWAKVKRDEAPVARPLPDAPCWRRERVTPDFRFVNINALTDEERARLTRDEHARLYFDLFAAQLLSRCSFRAFPQAKRRALRSCLRDKDVGALVELIEDPGVVKLKAAAAEAEPLDLMFLN